jgi:hypothetical protein
VGAYQKLSEAGWQLSKYIKGDPRLCGTIREVNFLDEKIILPALPRFSYFGLRPTSGRETSVDGCANPYQHPGNHSHL